jgi:hypothetical protein
VNANDPGTLIIGAIVLLAVIAGVVVVARARRKAQSEHLQERFGPEYSRVMKTVGDREKAEAELPNASLSREARRAFITSACCRVDLRIEAARPIPPLEHFPRPSS